MVRQTFIKTERAYDKLKYGLKHKLHLFGDVIMFPYRGFGNEDEAFLRGRVLEKEEIIHGDKIVPNTLVNNLKKSWKRYASNEIPGVGVKGIFHGVEADSISDHEGYFDLHFHNLNADEIQNGWHTAHLEITHMPFNLDYEPVAEGEILISKQFNGCGIISDIDDTILHTNILNKLKMVLNTIRYDAMNRIAFDGVSELYQKLSDNHRNPLIFISGSSYNLYEMLDTFCQINNIPKAPFLLRDLGIGPDQWITQKSHSFKMENAEVILNTYKKLPFILIGDSGEKDPEIYHQIYKDFPGRIKAIYIRHVHSDKRKKELLAVADDLDIPFLLIKHTCEILEHTREMGWISD